MWHDFYITCILHSFYNMMPLHTHHIISRDITGITSHSCHHVAPTWRTSQLFEPHITSHHFHVTAQHIKYLSPLYYNISHPCLVMSLQFCVWPYHVYIRHIKVISLSYHNNQCHVQSHSYDTWHPFSGTSHTSQVLSLWCYTTFMLRYKTKAQPITEPPPPEKKIQRS